MPEVPRLSVSPSHARLFGRTREFLAPHRAIIGAGLLSSLAASACAAAFAPLVGRATDALLHRQSGVPVVVATVMLVVAAVQALLERHAGITLALAGERVVTDVRQRAVERLASVDLRFLETHRTGDLLRRTTTEIADLADFLRRQLPEALSVVATLTFTFAVLIASSVTLTLVAAVAFLPASMLLFRGFRRRADAVYAQQASVAADIAAAFAETVDGREALLTPADVVRRTARIGGENARAVDAVRGVVRVQRYITALGVVESLTLAALVLVGSLLVQRGELNPGAVVVFVLAGRTLFSGFSDLTGLVAEAQTARTGLARVFDLFDLTATPMGTGAHDAPVESADLHVEGVGFAYDAGVTVLRDVTFMVPAGAHVGLVGASGSGKTTLAKILTGLYRPDTGSVRLGGVPLVDLNAELLRRHVVLVPQDVHLIAGTIADNIALAPARPERADIERAVASLGLTKWMAELPHGLDTDVGSRGDRLSAGERQMLALVRAALVDPAVLVLDEATADIDPVTARRLESAIARVSAHRTVIVIAHRASTIARLPLVVTLDDGRVAG